MPKYAGAKDFLLTRLRARDRRVPVTCLSRVSSSLAIDWRGDPNRKDEVAAPSLREGER